ncbi:MAG: TFIIB-type zinc ribbon-containing protein, partial [Promethearchaeota archaeon]
MIKITQLKLIELNEYESNHKSSNWCEECGGNIIFISETGESVCQECGLVVNERAIDLSHSDKRAYTNQDIINKEHFGSLITPLTPRIALHTIVPAKEIRNSDLRRAAKWNTRVSWNEKNILIATKELKRISSNLNLPDYIKVSAINVYKKAFKMNIIKGRSINTMVAACIYYACRNLKVNRTLQEILEECN